MLKYTREMLDRGDSHPLNNPLRFRLEVASELKKWGRKRLIKKIIELKEKIALMDDRERRRFNGT